MHLHLLLLLFSSGVSGYFLPLKEMLHLQNMSIIDEMLCLLEAEKDAINEHFFKPLHIKNENCAHCNAKTFIHELKKIPPCKCLKTVEKDMEKLEKDCSILKKSSSNDETCSEMEKTGFSQFKKSLEEFLKWVNQNQFCSKIMRRASGLYPDGKCICSNPWKYRKGLL
ncbi:uncharacterized protein LJ206_015725 [Theristicus caerulescens]